MKIIGITSLALALSACATIENNSAPPTSISDPIIVTTSDDVRIYGTPYFGNLGSNTPLILLFHQGGSNGRGEYEPLIGWINENGFRAIAWDQRRGGERLGSENRTVLQLPSNTEYSYCDASPDFQAALDFTTENELADKVIVWGSSYSAALIFELAKNNPSAIQGVISFSPASGGPMVDCRARIWLDRVSTQALVLRPASEMERDPSKEQRSIFETAGVNFKVVEDGVHGSSMLVDARTQSDMSDAREFVMSWLMQAVE